MTPGEIETVYEALATWLDRVGEARRDLFLAKLVLLLAVDGETVERVLHRMEEAARDID